MNADTGLAVDLIHGLTKVRYANSFHRDSAATFSKALRGYLNSRSSTLRSSHQTFNGLAGASPPAGLSIFIWYSPGSRSLMGSVFSRREQGSCRATIGRGACRTEVGKTREN